MRYDTKGVKVEVIINRNKVLVNSKWYEILNNENMFKNDIWGSYILNVTIHESNLEHFEKANKNVFKFDPPMLAYGENTELRGIPDTYGMYCSGNGDVYNRIKN